MQVLHIITGLKRGGAETLLYRICQFDKEYNHTVISLTGMQDYGKMLNQINVSVYALNFSNSKINFFGLFKLYKLIREIKPDVVQTWMSHADLIGGVMIVKLNALLSYLVPKKIIYCAEKSREIQELIGFKKTKGVVIQNGYDINSFYQDNSLTESFRNELDISLDEFVIGHVGSYDPLKDQKTLIKSLAYLDQNSFNFIAVLVGIDLDNANNTLVRLLKENGLTERVHLLGLIVGKTGWVVKPKDPKALANASIQALKEKQSNNESWGQRKDACRQRIVENFTLEKMIKKYKEVWVTND